jgi:hypothetical protein
LLDSLRTRQRPRGRVRSSSRRLIGEGGGTATDTGPSWFRDAAVLDRIENYLHSWHEPSSTCSSRGGWRRLG